MRTTVDGIFEHITHFVNQMIMRCFADGDETKHRLTFCLQEFTVAKDFFIKITSIYIVHAQK